MSFCPKDSHASESTEMHHKIFVSKLRESQQANEIRIRFRSKIVGIPLSEKDLVLKDFVGLWQHSQIRMNW